MKIAVIGSGFYGSTLALLLSKNHNVELFEKEKDIRAARHNRWNDYMLFSSGLAGSAVHSTIEPS